MLGFKYCIVIPSSTSRVRIEKVIELLM